MPWPIGQGLQIKKTRASAQNPKVIASIETLDTITFLRNLLLGELIFYTTYILFLTEQFQNDKMQVERTFPVRDKQKKRKISWERNSIVTDNNTKL